MCINWGLCLPECPVGAIVASEDEDQEYAESNKELTPKFKDNPPAAERPKNDPPPAIRQQDRQLGRPPRFQSLPPPRIP